MAPKQDVRTAAEAYLVLLKARGIDWLLANAGTDFAPIIEALSRGAQAGLAMPEPVVVPHENAAVGMAHGYYLVTGRPQAVMVHVNVGTANALMGLLNAARDNVPIFFTSGRTPITDADRVGARDLPIHWGQEMRDQAGMLREYVKWDYELRYGEQVELIVDRALAIAMTEPRGPVYLSLPREALAAPVEDFAYRRAAGHAGAGDASSRSRGDRAGGGHPGGGRAAADHRGARPVERARLCGAGRPCRALRDSGRAFLAVPSRARDRPSDACRLRQRAMARGCRRGGGARCDGALDSQAPRRAGRLPRDPDRAGSAVRRPADAKLPGEPCDRGRGARGAGCAGRGAGCARPRSGKGDGEPARADHRAQRRSPGDAARCDRGGSRHADEPGLDQPLPRSRQRRGRRAVQ